MDHAEGRLRQKNDPITPRPREPCSCTTTCPTPLPAAGLSIFTPTREDTRGVPYLHMAPNTGTCANPADTSGTVKKPVLTEAGFEADAKTIAERKQHLRMFGYADILSPY